MSGPVTALRIPADPALPITRLALSDDFRAWQREVDGPVELMTGVPVAGRARAPRALPDVHALVNEEGIPLGLQPNDRATLLLRGALPGGGYLAGTVLLVGDAENGELGDCPADVLDLLAQPLRIPVTELVNDWEAITQAIYDLAARAGIPSTEADDPARLLRVIQAHAAAPTTAPEALTHHGISQQGPSCHEHC